VVALAIAGAWLLLAGAQLTGTSDLLHHHALIEHGPALWIALPVFVVAWLVMVVAMMLPASLPAIGSHLAAVGVARPAMPLASFLAPYALVWAAFGVAMFLGDTVVHRLLHAAPWLEARTWFIDAAVLGFSGVYQLLPIKRQGLEACRHPNAASHGGGGRFGHRLGRLGGSFGPGLNHALACLAGSWALMLLMFSEGFSSPAWMVALTGVMAYEATGRHGQLVAKGVGVLLLAAALGVIATSRPV
jgi:predicted metal-binding membrane protein